MAKEGPSHPCGRGQTTWTLTEKIGKFTVILSRPFHFAIILLLIQSIFLVKRMDLVDCLQIILFHLECRYEGKLLILGLYLDSIFASQLRKVHFVSNLGGFLVTVPSLVQCALCMSILSPKLPILVINLWLWSARFQYALALNYETQHLNFALAIAMARLAYTQHILVLIFISLVSTVALVLPMAQIA